MTTGVADAAAQPPFPFAPRDDVEPGMEPLDCPDFWESWETDELYDISEPSFGREEDVWSEFWE